MGASSTPSSTAPTPTTPSADPSTPTPIGYLEADWAIKLQEMQRATAGARAVQQAVNKLHFGAEGIDYQPPSEDDMGVSVGCPTYNITQPAPPAPGAPAPATGPSRLPGALAAAALVAAGLGLPYVGPIIQAVKNGLPVTAPAPAPITPRPSTPEAPPPAPAKPPAEPSQPPSTPAPAPRTGIKYGFGLGSW